MEFWRHPATHLAIVLTQSFNQLHIVVGFVIPKETFNYCHKAVPSCVVLSGQLLWEFSALDELLYLWCNENSMMGCRMSVKLHILDAHLDHFKRNSEERSERFLQDIMAFERRYQGQYNESMMGDDIWGLIRESGAQYNPKSRKTSHY